MPSKRERGVVKERDGERGSEIPIHFPNCILNWTKGIAILMLPDRWAAFFKPDILEHKTPEMSYSIQLKSEPTLPNITTTLNVILDRLTA